MPVDRVLHSQPIRVSGAPSWICPTCGAGRLKLDSSTLNYSKSGESARASSEDWYGPEHVEYRFATVLKCENTDCREVSAIAGRGEVDEHPDDRMEHLEYEDVFYPTYFKPSPRLIVIPNRCPAEVRTELEAAFVGSWGEFASSANRVRVAVELLLDALRIPKTSKTKTGKRSPLVLHKRIESLPNRHDEIRTSLLAIKWIGNHGAHDPEISRDAVFDALDIFESVLIALYSDNPRRIRRLVAAVNKRKGPTRRCK